MRGIDMKGFKVVYKDRVYNALDMRMDWKDEDQLPKKDDTGTLPGPTWLDVVVLNEDGQPCVIRDEAYMFQFLRIAAKGAAYGN